MSVGIMAKFSGATWSAGPGGTKVTDAVRIEIPDDEDTVIFTTQDATIELTAGGALEIAEFILRNVGAE